MKNIAELREEALNVVRDLRSGKLKPPVAVEINNAIGKACLTVKLELEYAKISRSKPKLPFLEVEAVKEGA